MAIFIVAYDLNRPVQKHKEVSDFLSRFAHCHAQQSVWLVEARSAASLRDALRAHLDSNDVLLVSEVSTAWAGLNMGECATWLNENGY